MSFSLSLEDTYKTGASTENKKQKIIYQNDNCLSKLKFAMRENYAELRGFSFNLYPSVDERGKKKSHGHL